MTAERLEATTEQLYTAIYAYPWSVRDEGVRPMLAAIAGRAGCDAVCMAFHYHSGKLLQPHKGGRRLHFSELDGVQFRPTPERYAQTGIKPNVSRAAIEHDVLSEVCVEAGRLGLDVIAWIVCLHTSGQASRHPQVAQTTVYGDPLTFALCPSHPDVREYVTQLVVDAAVKYEPVAVELESLEYLPFSHGHHHELAGIALDPYHEFLLGLDFNPYTKADMENRGVDVDRVAFFVRSQLDRFFDRRAEQTDVGFEYLPHVLLSQPALVDFLRARMAIVTDLIAEIAAAVRLESKAKVHAILSMWKPLHLGWVEGYDPAGLERVVDRVGLPAYYDPAGISREVIHLGREIANFNKITALVDAGAPLTTSAADLAGAVHTIRELGIDHLNFYNYSLIREETLDWIRQATRSCERPLR